MSIPISQASFFFKRVEATSVPSTVRCLAGNRTSSTNIELWSDGSIVTTSSTADTGAIPATRWIHGGLFNSDTTASDLAYYTAQVETLGGSLTSTQMTNLYNDSLTFCNSLGRS